MVGPKTRSKSRGCARAQFQDLSSTVRQNRATGSDLTGSVELDKSILPELQKQPYFSSGSGSGTQDKVHNPAPSPPLPTSSLEFDEPAPPARVMRCPLPSPSTSCQPVGATECERPGSSVSTQPARVMRCERPGSSGSAQPARVMRCERPGSSGSAQPARVMRCERPGSSGSAQPVRIMSCERPGSSGSAQPARVMRCERPGSSVSTQPARVMRCERPGSSVSTQLARVMKCERPGSSGSAQPAKVMRCGRPGSSVASWNSMNSSQELGGKDETAAVLKGISDGSENLNGIALPGNAQTNTAPDSLHICAHHSSYSCKALNAVPSCCEGSIDAAQSSCNYNVVQNNGQQIMTTVSYIDQLPDEVLCMIFSHLPRIELLRVCSKVCRRWLQVAKSSPLWRTLSFCSQDIPIEVVCGFIRLSPCLKTITIKDRTDVDIVLPILHQQCKQLESVNIVRCRPSDGNQKILRAKSLYPFLRRGQLHNLNLKGTDYRSRKFYQMLSSLPSLRKLNISCSKGVSPQILGEIAKLTSLKVFKHKWHSNSIYYGDKSMTIQLPGRIGDWGRAYAGLFRGVGKNLTTLEIYAAGISDTELSSLAFCKQLKKLAVFNANCFGSESTAAVGSLLNLKELLIHNAKLTTVDVAGAFNTGNLSCLKCLHLNDSVLSNNDLTADACLKIVAGKCPDLQHLSFTKCSSLTDAGVQSVFSHCPQLVSLDLNGGHGISGQSFLSIPTKTPSLQLLVIEEDCSQEKKEILKQLSESFPLKIETISTWKHRTTSYFL